MFLSIDTTLLFSLEYGWWVGAQCRIAVGSAPTEWNIGICSISDKWANKGSYADVKANEVIVVPHVDDWASLCIETYAVPGGCRYVKGIPGIRADRASGVNASFGGIGVNQVEIVKKLGAYDAEQVEAVNGKA